MTPEELNIKIEALTTRVKELEDWNAQRLRQQITFPLDPESIKAINKYFMRITDDFYYFGGVGAHAFQTFTGVQDKLKFELYRTLIRYTAEPTTDIITIVEPTTADKYANDDTVVLFTDDTVPGGLTGNGSVTYYVVSAASDGYSFKLSASLGGAAINITSTGSGRQFLSRI